MATYNAKTYRAILADMEAWIIATQDKITDFNEGAGITSFVEAVAQQVEQIYLRAKIGFIKYLPNLPFYAFGFAKNSGTNAVGVVVFSRNTATTDSVSIPIGTIVSTSSGLRFITTTLGTILANETASDDVAIEAYDIGTQYNVPANTIDVMTTSVVGVDTVDNAAATTGGLDEETDNAFEQRFHTYVLGLGRGNVSGLITCAKSVEGVRSASVVEHFPPITGFWNVSLYIDDGTGLAPDTLITAVEEVLIGDGTTSNPGYKPAGINVRVLGPTLVPIPVTVVVTSTGSISDDTIKTNIQTAIENYINTLVLGEDFIYYELINVLMGVPGVYNLVLSTPTDDVTIAETQIARTGTITITFAV
ncbi:MAG: hypothetical protein C4K49_10530 [Candidatus Thorarchaeota archaeon]|nr:MAG: hypothetical protein C4K49_10530 [Candidatus Thorarchaeota archaeon]